MLEHAIETGRGGVFLRLTPEQLCEVDTSLGAVIPAFPSRTLREKCLEAYYFALGLRRPTVEVVSQEELAKLAIKLRNDLFDYEDKLGSCRDFGELKNSAGMLVVAILEPVEFRLTATPPKKTAQVYQFPPRRGSTPESLH
jgi:hypothetical protein